MVRNNPVGALTFATWNANGMGSQVKRGKVFAHLKSLSADIIFLQETHIKPSDQCRLKSKWFSDVYQSTFSSEARGVAILLKKNVLFQLSDFTTDPAGRYLIVSGNINNIPITCLNIYGPNIDDPDFFWKVFNLLPDLNSTNLICGGDYNCYLDPYLDRMSSRPPPCINSVGTLNNLIRTYNLIDIWRIQHPVDKEYSFFHMYTKHILELIISLLTQSYYQMWCKQNIMIY